MNITEKVDGIPRVKYLIVRGEWLNLGKYKEECRKTAADAETRRGLKEIYTRAKLDGYIVVDCYRKNNPDELGFTLEIWARCVKKTVPSNWELLNTSDIVK